MTDVFQLLEEFSGNTCIVTDAGREMSYAQLLEVSGKIAQQLKTGSMAFCFCGNQVGSVAGYLSFLHDRMYGGSAPSVNSSGTCS